MPDRDALLVDAGEQLRKLGLAMSRCKLDRMNIHLLLSIDTLPMESERCWRLALAVYELVDERGPPCLLRRPRRRNQNRADACRFLGELSSDR